MAHYLKQRLNYLMLVNLMLKDLEMAELKTNEIKRFIGRGAENLIKQSLDVSSKKDPTPVFANAEKLFAQHYINFCK